jgi:hypothetical protein
MLNLFFRSFFERFFGIPTDALLFGFWRGIEHEHGDVDDDRNVLLTTKDNSALEKGEDDCLPSKPIIRQRIFFVTLRTIVEMTVVGVFCYIFVRLFENPFCDVMFACGCYFAWLDWDTGWSQCNVHNAPPAPRCPFCAADASVNWLSVQGVMAALPLIYVILATILYYKRWQNQRIRWQKWMLHGCLSLLVIVAAFFLLELLLGVIFFVATPEYPYFLGFGKSPGHKKDEM